MRAIDADALSYNFDGMMAVSPTGYIHGDTIADMIGDAPTIELEQKWIPCSERLPERNRVVIVTTKWDEVTEGVKLSGNAWFIGSGEENAFDSDIIAWMPLPEPYKKENR